MALAASLVLVAAHVLPGWWLLANSAILLAALVFERSGYHPRASIAAKERLRRTQERFLDPTSGKLLEVWEDPVTGAREYRPVQAAEQPPDRPSA